MLRRNFIASLIALPFIAKNTLGNSDSIQHWSDCATNSEPAYPAGPCNCFHVGARIEHKEVGWTEGEGFTATVTEITDRGVKYKGDRPLADGEILFKDFEDWRRI